MYDSRTWLDVPLLQLYVKPDFKLHSSHLLLHVQRECTEVSGLFACHMIYIDHRRYYSSSASFCLRIDVGLY